MEAFCSRVRERIIDWILLGPRTGYTGFDNGNIAIRDANAVVMIVMSCVFVED
jgi:hypothetical protein